MTEFLYCNAIANIRIPINEDGSFGRPELLGGFVTNPLKKKAVKPKAPVMENRTSEAIEL